MGSGNLLEVVTDELIKNEMACEVWREDQELLSRSGRKRRPPSLLDGGILWFFSNCGTTVGFLTRYDGVLREPLVWY